jgi:hypothetical protein
MGKFFSKIETSDILIFLGLTELGVGLFFWFGKGVSMTVVGALLFCMGFFGGMIQPAAHKKDKK